MLNYQPKFCILGMHSETVDINKALQKVKMKLIEWLHSWHLRVAGIIGTLK